jgi:DeoR family ulaG and ulaABCDEF operon transcriptional repressor
MLKEERCNLILKTIEGREAVSWEDLLAVVDASSATVRRDVDQLSEAGLLRKIRGGVAPVLTARVKPLQSYRFLRAQSHCMDEKDAIARRALELVAAPDTIIVFGGTTCARFAEYLPSAGLTVLTDSLPVASHLTLETENRVFMTGGEVLAEQGIVLSPFDDAPLYHIAASTMFIGCHAVTPAGIMEDDPLPLRGVQCRMRQAERLVVLADSSKFLESRSLVVCPLHEVDVFVTDDHISDRAHAMLVDAGVTVLVAETGPSAASTKSPTADRPVTDEDHSTQRIEGEGMNATGAGVRRRKERA